MKIAIATSFSSWAPSYSIAHVAITHANAFTSLGHTVQIWGEEGLPSNPAIDDATVVLGFSLHEYRPDNADGEAVAQKIREFTKLLDDFQPDIIISHDLIFQTAFVAYAEAIHQLPLTPGQVWFHLTHSNVLTHEPYQDGARYRRTVPQGHYLLALGPTHKNRISQYYQYSLADIFVCSNPHAFLDGIAPASIHIINELRLLERDLVQIYPVCGTRFAEKGTRWLVDTFDALKARGQDVCLIIVNANSDTDHVRHDILNNYMAEHLGDNDLIFTSERWPEWAKGVPHEIVADLVQFSNLFVFPSQTEACSLALAEAQAAGCLCVLNENCTGQMDYRHQSALTFPFDGVDFKVHFHTEETTQINQDGKVSVKTRVLDEQESRTVELDKLAARIISTAEQCQPLMARRFAARTYEPRAVAKHILQLAGMAKGYQDAIAT